MAGSAAVLRTISAKHGTGHQGVLPHADVRSSTCPLRLSETFARYLILFTIMAQLARYRFLFIAVVFHLVYIYRCAGETPEKPEVDTDAV